MFYRAASDNGGPWKEVEISTSGGREDGGHSHRTLRWRLRQSDCDSVIAS